MRFVVDAQLPPALARFLTENMREDAVHVLDVGLLNASDTAIWTYALEHGRVIITKDDDFQIRASVSKIHPQIVWVRVGNCSRQKLLLIFEQHWSTIKSELSSGTPLIEIA